jgi:uncharacterized protein (UPF0210 family)
LKISKQYGLDKKEQIKDHRTLKLKIMDFGALVDKNLTESDRLQVESLPDVFQATDRVCSFLNVGINIARMNLDAVNMIGHMLKETASKTKDAIGCAEFAVFVNAS